MPPKKIAAVAKAVKDRITNKTAAKKPTAAKEQAERKTVAKKSVDKNGAVDDAASITAENNPAAAPKRTLRSAGKAPARPATASKNRKASDDEENEDKVPPTKKAKATTTRASAGKKRKTSDVEDEKDGEQENEAPPAKKAKTATASATERKKSKTPVSEASTKKAAANKSAAKKTETKDTGAQKSATQKTTGKKTATGKAVPSKASASQPDVPTKTTTEASSQAQGKKRKTAEPDENEEKEDEAPREPKKVKVTKVTKTAAKEAAPKNSAPKKSAPKKSAPKEASKEAPNPALKIRIGVQINFAPTQPLDIFVFGEGSAGELGLGSRRMNGKMPIDVKRPRFNPNLSGNVPGVVQFACGGMHGIALTKDNKVLTWGVNDNGALGRDTTWTGGYRHASPQNDGENESAEHEESSDEDDEDESGLNPREATPAEISLRNVAPGSKFVQVAATDSASFALTEDGRIYSWGTFRASDGILGFDKDVREQYLPVLLDEPRKIVSIATGSNHVLTLDNKGKVQTWGTYQQNQLGRRIVERDACASALRPGGLPFKRGVKIAKVAAGSYHSFALTTEGQVYAWGLNNFGELGVEDMMGEDGATVLQPTLVEALLDYKIVDVAGGEHHSVALTDDGKVLVWGRMDSNQCGFARETYTHENSLYDGDDLPRILVVPTQHNTIPAPVSAIAVGTDTTIVVTDNGEAWSWGFNTTYQCGVGKTSGEVYPPQAIDNSVVRERKIVAAGCGGQFSMLAARHEEEEEE